MAFDRLMLGWLVTLAAAGSLLVLFAGHAPFPYDPRVIANGPRPLAGFATVMFVAAYFVSLLSYLSLHGHQREEDATIDTSSGRARERLKRAA